MPQATTPPSNSWEPDSASGNDPMIATNDPAAQPLEPPQRLNGPLLRPDGSMMTPGEAYAQALPATNNRRPWPSRGYPLWQQTTAQKPKPSS